MAQPEMKYVEMPFREELERLGWKVEVRRGIPEDYIIEEDLKEHIKAELGKEKNIRARNMGITEEDVLREVKRELQIAEVRDIVRYLKTGMTITVNKGDGRNNADVYVTLISDDPKENGYRAIFQAKLEREDIDNGERYPDAVLYINGIPVAIIEFKYNVSSQELARNAGLREIGMRITEHPTLFKIAPITAVVTNKRMWYLSPKPKDTEDNFFLLSWKIPDEPMTPEETAKWYAREAFEPKTITKIIRDYLLYRTTDNARILPKYMQYEAVEEIRNRVIEYLERTKKTERAEDDLREIQKLRRMLVWHYQGTGKTFEMVMAAYVIDKEFKRARGRGTDTIFVVDRRSLEQQLVREYLNAIPWGDYGIALKPFGENNKGHVPSVKEFVDTVQRMVKKPQPNWFAVILAKFGGDSEIPEDESEIADEEAQSIVEFIRRNPTKAEEIMERDDIVLIIDEIHRGLYRKLGGTLFALFKNAIKIGFSGTPKFKDPGNQRGELDSFDLFGKPIHAYWMDDAVRDENVVPIVVKPKHVILNMNQTFWKRYETLLKQIEQEVAEEGGDAIVEFRKEFLQKLRRDAHNVLGAERVVSTIARDALDEFESMVGIETSGNRIQFGKPWKAIFVAPDRKSAYRYMQALQRQMVERLMQRGMSKESAEEIAHRTIVLIVSNSGFDQELNEKIDNYYKTVAKKYWGAESGQELALIFKQNDMGSKYPRIAVVTAMLLTGYDLPTLKIMYVAKIMRKHNLLQAIGRVNRQYPKKIKGIIIDYTGILPILIAEAKRAYEKLREEITGEKKEYISALDEWEKRMERDAEELTKAAKTLKVKIRQKYEGTNPTRRLAANIAKNIAKIIIIESSGRNLPEDLADVEFYEEIWDNIVEITNILDSYGGWHQELEHKVSKSGNDVTKWIRWAETVRELVREMLPGSERASNIDTEKLTEAIMRAIEVTEIISEAEVSVDDMRAKTAEPEEKIKGSTPLYPPGKTFSIPEDANEEDRWTDTERVIIGGVGALERVAEQNPALRPLAEIARQTLLRIIMEHNMSAAELRKAYSTIARALRAAGEIISATGENRERYVRNAISSLLKMAYGVQEEGPLNSIADTAVQILKAYDGSPNAKILIAKNAPAKLKLPVTIALLRAGISNPEDIDGAVKGIVGILLGVASESSPN